MLNVGKMFSTSFISTFTKYFHFFKETNQEDSPVLQTCLV